MSNESAQYQSIPVEESAGGTANSLSQKFRSFIGSRKKLAIGITVVTSIIVLASVFNGAFTAAPTKSIRVKRADGLATAISTIHKVHSVCSMPESERDSCCLCGECSRQEVVGHSMCLTSNSHEKMSNLNVMNGTQRTDINLVEFMNSMNAANVQHVCNIDSVKYGCCVC